METPQNQEDGMNKLNSSSNLACRQSSARWTPTSEQIRILKELYYTNGVRSPTADQIQRISAKLKEYGKIEGKNVFYWFQNHKARERQKKRFTTNAATSPPPPPCGKYYQDHPFPPPPPLAGFPSSSTSFPHLLNVGPAVCGGYGSVAMEKSFRDCSISPADPYFPSGGYYPFLEKRKYVGHETLEHDEQQLQEEEEDDDVETLPLFPIQSEQMTLKQETYNFNNGRPYGPRADEHDYMASSRASLELTLSSYSAKRLN